MPITKPVAKASQQRQSQKSAALRLASQNARQSLHNGPALPEIPQGVQNIALERQGIRPPVPGGIDIGHAPVFTGSPAPLNGTGLPDNSGYAPGTPIPGLPSGTYAPGQMLPGGGNPGMTVQQPQSPDQYGALIQALNNQGIQASADPHTGQVGWAQYAPGISVYEPQGGQELNQAQNNALASLTDPYLGQQYKDQAMQQLTGITPSPAQQVPNNDLQQAMVNASQSGANSNPNTIQPQTPVASAPVSPATPSQTITSPTVQPAQNPQQLGNQNVPGFISNTPEGGQQPANRILPRPGNPAGIATRPVVRPLGSVGNMMGSGFGGAASRLMGRL